MAATGANVLICPRLQGLEKKVLFAAGETPAVVLEMKKQVDCFRQKLEVSAHAVS